MVSLDTLNFSFHAEKLREIFSDSTPPPFSFIFGDGELFYFCLTEKKVILGVGREIFSPPPNIFCLSGKRKFRVGREIFFTHYHDGPSPTHRPAKGTTTWFGLIQKKVSFTFSTPVTLTHPMGFPTYPLTT
jgi:hypothetical protein